MGTQSLSQPVVPFRMAAFHVDAESLRGVPLDRFLDFTLASTPGDGGPDQGGCSEFSCNLYSPPPPDQQIVSTPTPGTEEETLPSSPS